MIRILGDFDLAEDAVQEAFAEALRTWPERGVPRNPGAWIA
jgi:RNA polymerase sigma-70 factor (ECF subfamily)